MRVLRLIVVFVVGMLGGATGLFVMNSAGLVSFQGGDLRVHSLEISGAKGVVARLSEMDGAGYFELMDPGMPQHPMGYGYFGMGKIDSHSYGLAMLCPNRSRGFMLSAGQFGGRLKLGNGTNNGEKIQMGAKGQEWWLRCVTDPSELMFQIKGDEDEAHVELGKRVQGAVRMRNL